MKNLLLILAIALSIISCKKEETLQTYFVENSEKQQFIVQDIAPSILNLESSSLSQEQKKALATFEKLNILAYKPKGKSKADLATYENEKSKVQHILKDKKYQELIKIGSGKDAASISFVGDENHIDEFVLYGAKKENGFAVIRILGNDMNPADAMTFMSLLQKSNINVDELKGLQQFMNN